MAPPETRPADPRPEQDLAEQSTIMNRGAKSRRIGAECGIEVHGVRPILRIEWPCSMIASFLISMFAMCVTQNNSNHQGGSNNSVGPMAIPTLLRPFGIGAARDA